MKHSRMFVALVAAAALLPLTAPASYAAAPTNDVPAGAVALTLGQTWNQDTTEATTDALDAALNRTCGAPVTNASVWFTYTDPTGAGFLADMTASDYSGGFIVTAGDPANGDFVACGPDAVAVRGTAGTTYYLVAFSDNATLGGNLSVTLSEPPPAPEVTLTIDPRGTADKAGTAHISGTYSCSNADGYQSDIEGMLTQRVGRTKITGFFFSYPLECDGAVHPWDAFVVSDTGLFSGGKAANVSVAFACGMVDCAAYQTGATIQLDRARTWN